MQNLRLKGKIVEAGFTYVELARMVEVTPPTIQKAVNGGNIGLITGFKIAKALNCKVEDVFTINENGGK